MQQKERILSLLQEQNEKLVETIETEKLTPQLDFNKKFLKYRKMFPIKSLQELDEMEEFICDKNLKELVGFMFKLILKSIGILIHFSR